MSLENLWTLLDFIYIKQVHISLSLCIHTNVCGRRGKWYDYQFTTVI